MMSFGTTWGSEGAFSPLMTALIAVFAVILIGTIGRALYVWFRNNRSPQETADARVITKRTKVTGHGGHAGVRNAAGMNTFSSSTYTRYFVTFELDNGKRLEFSVKDPEYGMLAEGDRGRLSWQGTRYLGFERV